MPDRFAAPEHAWAHAAASKGTPRLHRVLDRAIDAADLSAIDIYSLGDWIEPLDPSRADHLGLLLVAMFLAAAEGSLAIELSVDALRHRLEGLDPELDSWIASALEDLHSGKFEHVIGDGRERGIDRRPLLVWPSGERKFLYFQKHLRAEQDLDSRLRELAARPDRARPTAVVVRALNEVLQQSPLKSQGRAVVWDADQLTAIGLSLLRDVMIVSGGPGTGKTSVVLTLLRCLIRLGVAVDRIALAAPTGRAAQRLTDSLRAGLESLDPIADVDRQLAARSATTLHSLLEYSPHRGIYRRHEENPLAADVVLVDEVSMVSVEQMASLIRAVPPDSQLILLGDKDQLPSVDAGAVLAQLVPGTAALGAEVRAKIAEWLPGTHASGAESDHWLRDSVVVLRTNHRSEQGIRIVADAVNSQRSDVLESLPRLTDATPSGWQAAQEQGGCWWWEQTAATAQEVRTQIYAWAAHVYDGPLSHGGTFFDLVHSQTLSDDVAENGEWLARLFQALDRTRLLTLVRQGAWGCDSINEALQTWLRRRSASNRDWLPGTPILITQNDRLRGLSNGDVGLTLAGPGGLSRVVFARHGGFLSLSPTMLPGHDLGFALTVHKSQGSEFQQALVMLPPTGARRLLTKELLYTAMTRAKKLAVISSTAESFRAAVARRIVRESGLSL